MKPERFWADIPFTKDVSDSDGSIDIKGYASTWAVDRDNEFVEKDAFGNLDEYLATNPILLWQHNKERPIGTVKSASLDENGLHVKAHVPKPDANEERWAHTAYQKVKAGIVKTFSIGGQFHKQHSGGGKKAIKKVDLYEISVVSIPANPSSIFEAAAKSIDGPLRPALPQLAIEQMQQVIGVKAMTDPDLLSMDENERYERYRELAGMFRKAGKMPPQYDAWKVIAPTVLSAKTAEERTRQLPQMVALMQRASGFVNADTKEIGDRIQALLSQAYDLQELLDGKQTDDDDDDEEPEGGERPPNLRSGDGDRRCGTCRYFNEAGMCRRYSYEVSAGQLCDSYSKAPEPGEMMGEGPGPGKAWATGESLREREAAVSQALPRGFYVIDLTDGEVLAKQFHDFDMGVEECDCAWVIPYQIQDGLATLGGRQDWREVEQQWVDTGERAVVEMAAKLVGAMARRKQEDGRDGTAATS
jgi:HK97 family phage prohead protease